MSNKYQILLKKRHITATQLMRLPTTQQIAIEGSDQIQQLHDKSVNPTKKSIKLKSHQQQSNNDQLVAESRTQIFHTNQSTIATNQPTIATVNPHKFTEFSSLSRSHNMIDRIIYMIISDVLNNFSEKQTFDRFIVSKKIETDDNQEYLLNNWEILSQFFQLPNRLKKNQKLVSQTIKFIINFVNGKYEFEKPIQINTTQKSIYNKSDSGLLIEKKITFTIIQL